MQDSLLFTNKDAAANTEEEEEQHNGGYGRPEIMNELQHSQIVSPNKDSYSFVYQQKNN